MPDVNKLDTPPSLTPIPTSSTSRPATPAPIPAPPSRTLVDTAVPPEAEQEAQVARLLNLIRLQHLQSDTPAPGENPALVAASFIGDGGNVPWLGSAHSDMAFYVAESQMLARENEMLKKRIGELERRVAELEAGPGPGPGPGVGVEEAGNEGGNEGGVQVEVEVEALPDDFVHAL